MKLINSLIKWVVILAAGLSAALLTIIFLSDNPAFNPLLLRMITLFAIGFVSGLVGRVLFSKMFAPLSILLVLAADLLSISLIDLFYEMPYQMDSFKNGFNPAAFSFSTNDGVQLLFMGLTSLMPLLILRRRRKKAVQISKPTTTRPNESATKPRKLDLRQINPRNWQIFQAKSKENHQPVKISTQAKIDAQLKQAVRINPSPKAPSLNPPLPAKPVKTKNHKPTIVQSLAMKLKMPSKLFSANSNDVKLVGEEKHICPYCLEEVVDGDERGVAICSKCGTWHHQDCWDLTGSCGVAHRNEL